MRNLHQRKNNRPVDKLYIQQFWFQVGVSNGSKTI